MGSAFLRAVAPAVALALVAGCLGGNAAQPESVPTASEPSVRASNAPPELRVLADPLTGEIPFRSTFTLEGQDPENANVTWFIDVDDDHASEASGKGLPGEYTHEFVEAGRYRVRATVTDGEHFVDAVATVLAYAPRIDQHPMEPLVFEGVITGAWANDYLAEPNVYRFTVPAVPNRIVATMEVGPTALDLDYVLRTPRGDWADGRANPNEPSGTLYDAKEADLLVEEPRHLQQLGDWTLEVWAGASVEGEYKVTIAFE